MTINTALRNILSLKWWSALSCPLKNQMSVNIWERESEHWCSLVAGSWGGLEGHGKWKAELRENLKWRAPGHLLTPVGFLRITLSRCVVIWWDDLTLDIDNTSCFITRDSILVATLIHVLLLKESLAVVQFIYNTCLFVSITCCNLQSVIFQHLFYRLSSGGKTVQMATFVVVRSKVKFSSLPCLGCSQLTYHMQKS